MELPLSCLGRYCSSTSYLELLQLSCVQEDGGIDCESLDSEPALRPPLFYVRNINPDCLYGFQISILLFIAENLLSSFHQALKEKYPMIDVLIR